MVACGVTKQAKALGMQKALSYQSFTPAVQSNLASRYAAAKPEVAFCLMN